MPYIDGKYFTEDEIRDGMRNMSASDREILREHIKPSAGSGGSFLASAAIGAVTGSALLGGLLGGSFLGGILGDEFSD